MAKIYNLEEIKRKREPHVEGPAKCLACGHKWEAFVLLEENTFGIPCPECKLERGEFVYGLAPSDPIYICPCGNDLFYVTPSGPFCLKCGYTISFEDLPES